MTQKSTAEFTVLRSYRGPNSEGIWRGEGILVEEQQLVKRQSPALEASKLVRYYICKLFLVVPFLTDTNVRASSCLLHTSRDESCSSSKQKGLWALPFPSFPGNMCVGRGAHLSRARVAPGRQGLAASHRAWSFRTRDVAMKVVGIPAERLVCAP